MNERISLGDKIFFFKRLHKLLKTGIPLRDSLIILASQGHRKKIKNITEKILDQVSSGRSLSESLENAGNFSESIFLNIRAGEETGRLKENVAHISSELEKHMIMKNKMISALIYPLFIALTTIALCLFLVGYMFPKIIPMFKSFHTTLPPTTRVLILISNFLKAYGLICFSISVLFILGIFAFLKTHEKAQEKIQVFLLKTMFLKNIMISYELARITRSLGFSISAGISIDTSLKTASVMTGCLPYRHALMSISAETHAGQTFSECLREFPVLFPPDTCSMIELAEVSGTLGETLSVLSEEFEMSMDDIIKKITSALEPGFMVVMGFVVGFVALSIISPLYAITQNIK